MPTSRTSRPWIFLLTPVFLLAGCEDMFTPDGTARNYDELVNRILNSIHNRSPEDAAQNLFNVTSPDERRDAIAFLETKRYGHEPPYMRAYEILATDPHPMVRAQAMRAIGTSRQVGEGKYLVKGLADKDEQVRRDAALGLLYTWDESAEEPLAKCVKSDNDAQTRIFAARALFHATNPDTFRALIDALQDRDIAVVSYAHGSLVLATGQDFGYEFQAWLAWWDQTYVTPAASAPASRP
jgi:HEAT repeat protein